jgi:NAD(P)-dependent dehydrogenase (short-subunit alcohol dehydrogenase family)
MGRDLNRVAIITGGAKGIGEASARRLASDGMTVVVTDIDDEGREVAAKIGADGGHAAFHHQDVTDEDRWEELIGEVRAAFGGLHVLVNNAGIGTFDDVEQETQEGWDRITDINQKGVWLGMKHGGPAIRDSGGGAIVNMSSIFGAVGGFGGSIAYHASKGSVRLMTKNAALRWAKEGVRVNSVHPGFIDTPMIEQAKGTDVEREILAATPMGRLGRAEEIADAVAFLASDQATYITGAELYVDGGWTAR